MKKTGLKIFIACMAPAAVSAGIFVLAAPETEAGRYLAAAFALLAGITAWSAVSGSIVSRLKELNRFVGAVSAGDFSGRLRVRGKGELCSLAEGLNSMAAGLGDKVDALTREKATLEAVLGGMSEGVLITDRQGRVMLANRGLRETFGISREDSLGRPFLEVIRNMEILRLIKLAYKKRETVTAEIEVQFPKPLYFMAGCVPVSLKGEFTGAVLVLHDVTRLKALERVRRDFVANVTHELKTPIAAIQGFAETLLTGALEDGDNARKFLGIIESNSRRLTRLIEDLLTLSRIELGEIKLDLRPVSVRNVCEEVMALLEPRVRGKSIRVALDVTKDMPRVVADRDRLYQIVLNVVDNSIKFTPEGGSITLVAEDCAGGFVDFSISDTGSGVPPEMIPRLGERFFRVDPARSRELGGTGLGLAIVKHMVSAHGGRMAISSYPQKGTKVTLSLPVATEDSQV